MMQNCIYTVNDFQNSCPKFYLASFFFSLKKTAILIETEGDITTKHKFTRPQTLTMQCNHDTTMNYGLADLIPTN